MQTSGKNGDCKIQPASPEATYRVPPGHPTPNNERVIKLGSFVTQPRRYDDHLFSIRWRLTNSPSARSATGSDALAGQIETRCRLRADARLLDCYSAAELVPPARSL